MQLLIALNIHLVVPWLQDLPRDIFTHLPVENNEMLKIGIMVDAV